jgi:hypothetical protein
MYFLSEKKNKKHSYEDETLAPTYDTLTLTAESTVQLQERF